MTKYDGGGGGGSPNRTLKKRILDTLVYWKKKYHWVARHRRESLCGNYTIVVFRSRLRETNHKINSRYFANLKYSVSGWAGGKSPDAKEQNYKAVLWSRNRTKISRINIEVICIVPLWCVTGVKIFERNCFFHRWLLVDVILNLRHHKYKLIKLVKKFDYLGHIEMF